MPNSEAAQPFWFPDRDNAKRYPPLDRDLRVGVAVVGGGIVGLTAAHLLSSAGREVALFEARRIGRQATGRSTAKVTSQHGKRYSRLIEEIGESDARKYATANEQAIGRIREISESLGLDCGLRTKPAYIFAETAEQASSLRTEADAAAGLGLAASFVTDLDLPFPITGALRFDDQAEFDPFRYLIGLAEGVSAKAGLFEDTRITEIEAGEPCRLKAGDATIRADHVVVATQMPVVMDGLFFAKAFPVAHPLAAAPLPDSLELDGMFISSASPTHSFRTAEKDGVAYLVAAGGEFKTGVAEEGTAQVVDLKAFLRRAFGIQDVSHLWINEDFRPMDGLPFIGRISSSKPQLLVATGFNAWGISQGTSAAGIIADLILGRASGTAGIFDASRLRPLAGGPKLIAENVKTAARLAGDRLLKRKVQTLDEIPFNQGGIIELEGEQLAVLRDDSGMGTALSAVCTHLGCIVGWNDVDRTWDCPCHGSRFDSHGEVISGPATAPLELRTLAAADNGESGTRK